MQSCLMRMFLKVISYLLILDLSGNIWFKGHIPFCMHAMFGSISIYYT